MWSNYTSSYWKPTSTNYAAMTSSNYVICERCHWFENNSEKKYLYILIHRQIHIDIYLDCVWGSQRYIQERFTSTRFLANSCHTEPIKWDLLSAIASKGRVISVVSLTTAGSTTTMLSFRGRLTQAIAPLYSVIPKRYPRYKLAQGNIVLVSLTYQREANCQIL